MNSAIATTAEAKIALTSVSARKRTLIGAPLRNTLLVAPTVMSDCFDP
jgi:hypothetical protein